MKNIVSALIQVARNVERAWLPLDFPALLSVLSKVNKHALSSMLLWLCCYWYLSYGLKLVWVALQYTTVISGSSPWVPSAAL